jgi:RNA polymerase sigma-70 factor (ECF subfamily)
MHTDESDAVLVRRARAGDKEAFATLLGRHRPLLLALCRRICGDPALAEDAAQEATLQALLGLDHLRHAEQFGPWLGGIGLNICRRWLRDRSYEAWSWEALYGGRQVQEPVDWSAGPEDVAEAADLVAYVRRAVADLPPRQRAAVMLFYLSGLTTPKRRPC